MPAALAAEASSPPTLHALRPDSAPLVPTPAGERFEKVKLQRAEPAMIKTVPGLFASVLYVDNLHAVSAELAVRKCLGWCAGGVAEAAQVECGSLP